MCSEVCFNSSGLCLSMENEVSWLTSEISGWTWRGDVMWLPWGVPSGSHWHVHHSNQPVFQMAMEKCIFHGLISYIHQEASWSFLLVLFFYVCLSLFPICLFLTLPLPLFKCLFIQYLLRVYSTVLGSGI